MWDNMPNDFVEVSRRVADIFCGLDNLELFYEFHHEIDETERLSEYYEDAIDELYQSADVRWIDNGMTKFVFSFQDIPNYVVKIPFLKVHEYGKDYGEEDMEFAYDGAKVEALNCLFGNKEGNDYCKLEQDLYFASFAYGLEDMFAGTFLSFTVDDTYPIYISKKAKVYDYNDIYSGKKYDDRIVNSVKTLDKKYKGKYIDLPDEIKCMVCEHWGSEKLDKLLEFINTFKMNDFHPGNFGQNEDGKIIFIDYSGFEC